MTPIELSKCTGARIDRATTFLPFILAAFDEFDINTPQRQAAFLAQVGHESGGLHWLNEIWGPTATQLRYDSRADLGNTRPEAVQIAAQYGRTPGEFWKGHGLIQVTGYDNHKEAGEALGVDLLNDPEQLAIPGPAARSAAWFWKSHGLNELADAGDFERITRRINGGLNGQDERVALYEAAQAVLA